MANLLPKTAKDSARGEYRARVGIVALSLSLVVFLSGVFLLSPSYFFSRQNARNATAHIQYEQDLLLATKGGDTRRATIDDINKKLSLLLRAFSSPLSAREVVDTVIAHKPSSVRVGGIFFLSSPGASTLTLTGVASDRNSLSTFIKSLDSDPLFSSVEIPISNFVEDKDIDFSIKLAIAPRPVKKL